MTDSSTTTPPAMPAERSDVLAPQGEAPTISHVLPLILLVPLADALFYGRPVGWTLGAFALAVLGALAVINRDLLQNARAWVALVLAVGLCLALVEHPGVLAVVMFLAAALSFLAVADQVAFTSAMRWLEGLMLTLAQAVVRALGDVFQLPTSMCAQANGQPRLSSLAAAWLLPAACGGVFLMLFAFANPVLDGWLNGIDWQRMFMQLPEAARVVFWMACAAGIWLLLRARPRDLDSGRAALAKEFGPGVVPVSAGASAPGVLEFLFSEAALIRCMLVFNAMFAAQNAMDIAYLWGGKSLPAGFTFASYAHRGTYPLIVTALLAAVFVLIACRPGASSASVPLTRSLMYLWVGQNVALVVSSMWRMNLYVEAYSLTYARLFGFIGMALVALGLMLIVARIVLGRSNICLVNANALAILAVLYVSCFVDYAAIIADYNVRHCREVAGQGVLLDANYLGELGPSALPALRRYNVAMGNHQNVRALAAERSLTNEVQTRLADWRGWTFRLRRVAKAAPLS